MHGKMLENFVDYSCAKKKLRKMLNMLSHTFHCTKYFHASSGLLFVIFVKNGMCIILG
jgi:hypothetical protein